MKKYLKLLFIIFISLFILTIGNYSRAATVNLAVSPSTTAKVGDTIEITVKINAAQWDLTLTANGKVIETWTELYNYKENLSKTFTASYKTTEAGNVTFLLTGDISDVTQDNKDISETKVIKVEKEEDNKTGGNTTSGNTSSGNNNNTGSGNTNTNTSSGSTTQPKEETPDFKSASGKVYTTQTANLRDSWSTSSKATLVQEGTELTLTATSTKKVNGYIWYRVSYNGQTKYIASNLVTTEAPEEEPKEPAEKSDNNALASLTIEGVTLEPSFNKDVTKYTATVSKDVTKLEVKAVAESSNSDVKIEGNENLKDGENTVNITVTAEDGTKRVYTIAVTKGETNDGAEDNKILKLSNLQIADVNFEEGFNPDLLSYELSLSVYLEKLKITATPNQSDAKVEIIGNENFTVGENIITILLTSADRTQTVTYQIKVTVPEKVENANNNNDDIMFYGICGGVIVLAVIAIIVIIVVSKKRNNYLDEDEDFENDDDGEVTKKRRHRKYDDENSEDDENEEDDEEVEQEEEKARKPRGSGKGKHSS